jgi:hypothetical protein
MHQEGETSVVDGCGIIEEKDNDKENLERKHLKK